MEKRARTLWLRVSVASFGFGALCLAPLAHAKPPACPQGQRPGITGCRSGAPQLRNADAAIGATEESKPSDGKASTGEKARSQKTPPVPDASLRPPNSLERANRRLLVEEIGRLEKLVKTTHPKSPDRPMLLLRLAGAYSELRALSERDYTRLEIQVEEMERVRRTTPPVNKQLAPETTGPSRRLNL